MRARPPDPELGVRRTGVITCAPALPRRNQGRLSSPGRPPSTPAGAGGQGGRIGPALFQRLAPETVDGTILQELTMLQAARDPYRLDTPAGRLIGQWVAADSEPRHWRRHGCICAAYITVGGRRRREKAQWQDLSQRRVGLDLAERDRGGPRPLARLRAVQHRIVSCRRSPKRSRGASTAVRRAFRHAVVAQGELADGDKLEDAGISAQVKGEWPPAT
jgi:hypothetical protein